MLATVKDEPLDRGPDAVLPRRRRTSPPSRHDGCGRRAGAPAAGIAARRTRVDLPNASGAPAHDAAALKARP
jgi:hypothetical protein